MSNDNTNDDTSSIAPLIPNRSAKDYEGAAASLMSAYGFGSQAQAPVQPKNAVLPAQRTIGNKDKKLSVRPLFLGDCVDLCFASSSFFPVSSKTIPTQKSQEASGSGPSQ